jgi:hypothetical protein
MILSLFSLVLVVCSAAFSLHHLRLQSPRRRAHLMHLGIITHHITLVLCPFPFPFGFCGRWQHKRRLHRMYQYVVFMPRVRMRLCTPMPPASTKVSVCVVIGREAQRPDWPPGRLPSHPFHLRAYVKAHACAVCSLPGTKSVRKKVRSRRRPAWQKRMPARPARARCDESQWPRPPRSA